LESLYLQRRGGTPWALFFFFFSLLLCCEQAALTIHVSTFFPEKSKADLSRIKQSLCG
jgi:hypothetical protein